MTTDEMITTLQYMLGHINSVMDAHILAELQLAQLKAERGPELPWQLITTETGNTTPASAVIALPADFLKEVEGSHLYLTISSSLIRLTKKPLDDLREKYSGVENSYPGYYAILGSEFHIYPISAESLPYEFQYYAKAATPATGDSGTTWSLYYPDLLMGLAGQSLCVTRRALDIKPRFDEMVAMSWRQINVENTAREVANTEDAYGGG